MVNLRFLKFTMQYSSERVVLLYAATEVQSEANATTEAVAYEESTDNPTVCLVQSKAALLKGDSLEQIAPLLLLLQGYRRPTQLDKRRRTDRARQRNDRRLRGQGCC